MSIFSNRTVARMPSDVTRTLGARQIGELYGRLAKQGDNAPDAEWEIAVIWCLLQAREIEAVPEEDGRRANDVIYCSRTTVESRRHPGLDSGDRVCIRPATAYTAFRRQGMVHLESLLSAP